MRVGVIDYGMGNLRSVRSALEILKADVHVTSDLDTLAQCDRLVLPGVGSFYRAMQNIRARGLDRGIRVLVTGGTPLLGICLGMQLLATHGTEDGESEGLGFIDAVVERFPFRDLHVPHVGFNQVQFVPGRWGLPSHDLAGAPVGAADFYFVHSYRMVCRSEADVAGWCNYGGRFAALVECGNVIGAQFHPEKSQSNGLKLLRRFVTGHHTNAATPSSVVSVEDH